LPPKSVCSLYTDCSMCSANPKCGWCAENNLCVEGNEKGPFYAACTFYDYQVCSGNCIIYNDCGSCVQDPFCGWCNAPELKI